MYVPAMYQNFIDLLSMAVACFTQICCRWHLVTPRYIEGIDHNAFVCTGDLYPG